MSEKLINFLALVPCMSWREPPKVWNEQLREALSENYVKVGFGGVLKLTEAGAAIVSGRGITDA